MHHLGPDPESLNDHVITTPRLVLEPPSRSHALAIYALASGPHGEEVTEDLLWDGPRSVEDVHEWIDSHQSEPFRVVGYGWVIVDRHGEVSGVTGNPLGSITLRPHHFPGRCTVGYWLGKAHWRRGVMTEALTALIGFAFDELDVVKVEAEVFERNKGGRSLVENIGMTREGELRRAIYKRGEWIDEFVYGIVPAEWPPSSP